MVNFLDVPDAVDDSSSLGVVRSSGEEGELQLAIASQDLHVSPALNDLPKNTVLSLGSPLVRATITATTLTVPGARDYNFLVTLPEPIDLTDLGTGEVMVTGPHGYCQIANFVAMRGCSLCYRINAPGDIWTQADNGVYRIYIKGDEAGSPGMMQAFLVEILENTDGCLMQNGRFESGLTHWVTFAGTEQVSADTHVSIAALMLSTTDSGTSQTVGVNPGNIYQLTGYSRSTCLDYSSFGMTFFNAEGSLLLRTDVGPINGTGWRDYFVVAIAPTNTAYVQVWTYQSSDRGTTHIDNLSLRQIHADNLPPVQVSQFSLINAPLVATDATFSQVFNLDI